MGNPVITQITLFVNSNREAADDVDGAGAQHAQTLKQAFGTRAMYGDRVAEENLDVRCLMGGTGMSIRYRYYSNKPIN